MAWIIGVAFATAASLPLSAANIATYEFLLGGPDSLTFISGSIASSTFSNRFSRFRPDTGTMSKMASDVVPNTNLVAFGTNLIWFTTREAPFRVGRADLSTVTGNPTYYAPATAPYDDMTIGADNSLWASNAGDGRVARIAQSGATSYVGDGSMHPTGITRANDGAIWFADAVNRRITKIDPVGNTFAHFGVPQVTAATVPERVTAVPNADAMWFATQDGFGSVDPATGAVQVVATEPQQPLHLKAGTDGTLWLADGTPYVTQFTPPGNYARLRVFEDPRSESAGLFIDNDGEVYVSDRWDWKLARIAIAKNTPADTTITEFYNQALDHYFVTANPDEAAAIDAGSAGPGWSRTSETWKGWTGGPIPNGAEVCRFYGSTSVNPATGARRGPNSHFYTLDPSECAGVKSDPGWTYEFAGKFWMVKPEGARAATCPSWTQALYRVYNNRFALNDSNHRYTTSVAIYNQMRGAGWSGEGIVMCAPL